MSYVNAQWYIGGSIGLNKNSLTNNISNREFTNQKSISGFEGSVNFQYRFNNWLGLETRAGYSSKGSKIYRTSFFDGVYTTTKNSYLQIPILIRLSINTNSKFGGYVNAGGYGAYWVHSSIDAAFPNILAPKDFDPNRPYQNIFQLVSKQTLSTSRKYNSITDNRLEFGTAIGAGINYKLNHRIEVFSEFMNYYSLTDQQKKYQINQQSKKNNTNSISAGILYSLK